MNELEFAFEETPWERFLAHLTHGDRVGAAELMALLEGESEDTVEEAFLTLEGLDVELDLAELPKATGTGEAALRLRQEEQFVSAGANPATLEPNDPLRLYLEELQEISTGSVEELLPLCQTGDEKAQTALMNACLQQVVVLAMNYVGRGVLLMDLIQEGNLGLWQAIACYDGGNFEVQCERRVRFALSKSVIDQARNSGVGQKMRRAVEDYRAVDERLLSDLGRNPTMEEIAQELHLPVEEVAVIAKMLENIRMMDKVRTVKEPEEEEKAEEENQAVEDTAYFQMRQRIADLLADLTEQDAKLLTLRFGLEGGLPMTPDQAGRQLGLTPDEVLARETAALAKLRTQQG